jgi:hypothetical protein
MWNRIGNLWCKKMHSQAMWPIHGKYTCSRCLREHTVEWEGPATAAEYGHQLSQQQTRVPIDSQVWLADQTTHESTI